MRMMFQSNRRSASERASQVAVHLKKMIDLVDWVDDPPVFSVGSLHVLLLGMIPVDEEDHHITCVDGINCTFY